MSNTVIGIDLGGTNIVGAAMKDGKIIKEVKRSTEAAKGAEVVLDNIADVISTLILEYPDVTSIGIGTPGAVDDDGVVSGAFNIKGLHQKNMYTELEGRLGGGLTFAAGNDVDVAALGESKFGNQPMSKVMIFVALGTGIGGGLVINGGIFHGATGNALEIGHIVTKQGGRPCTCGRNGCFETYGSATGIKRTFTELLTADTKSSVLEGTSAEDVTTKDIYDAAKAGDEFCLSVTAQVTEDLANGIGSLANTFNPDLVVIGGGVSMAGDFFFGPLRDAVKKECFEKTFNSMKIVASNLQDKAGIFGACALAL